MKYLALLLTLTIPSVMFAVIPMEPTNAQITARMAHTPIPIVEPTVEMQIARFAGAENVSPFLVTAIAKCESGLRHFVGNKVIRGHVNNLDIGLMQINLYWHEKEAKRLGYDLFDFVDNLRYGIYLIKTDGASRHYKASERCWAPKLAFRDV
jgi:hypothetical protein